MGFSGVIILKARSRSRWGSVGYHLKGQEQIKMGFSGVIIFKARSRSRWGSVGLSS